MIETPIDAIAWCKQKSQRVRVGRDDYQEIIKIIREINLDRIELRKQIKELEKQIWNLKHPKPPKHKSKTKADPQPFRTEGNGILHLQIPPDQK